MKPDSKGMVDHWAECRTCDWETGGKNCIGLASQHAAKTGHRVYAQTGYTYKWNVEGGN